MEPGSLKQQLATQVTTTTAGWRAGAHPLGLGHQLLSDSGPPNSLKLYRRYRGCERCTQGTFNQDRGSTSP